MILAAAFAAALWIVALAVPTATWASWLAHPSVDPPLTHAGATLWRVMLAVSGVSGLAVAGLLRIAGSMDASIERDQTQSRRDMLLVVAAMAAALGLRMMRIDESLWYDEIASWHTYTGGTRSSGAVIGAFLDPVNHVLHTLLNRWSIEWLMPALPLERAFRLPALVFSILTVPVMFALGRGAAGSRVGLLAAAFAAIAPVCVLEGVEARGYSMMIFFSASATCMLIDAYRSASPSRWLAYAALVALGVWSHFVTAWIAIGHAAWLAWRCAVARDERPRCLQGLLAIALAGVLSLTLYAPLIPGMLAWRANFLAERGDEPRILGPEGWHGLLQLGGAWAWWAALPGLALLLAGVRAARSTSDTRPASLLTPGHALGLAALGLPLMVTTVALSGSWLYARFMLFALPAAILAMSIGFDWLWTRNRAVGIAALLVLGGVWIVDVRVLPPKQPLRDAVEHIQQRQQAGDKVLVIGLAHDVIAIYAYDLRREHVFFFGSDAQALAAKLDSEPDWAVVQYPHHVPDATKALLLDRGYRVTRAWDGWADWGHGDVWIMQRAAAP